MPTRKLNSVAATRLRPNTNASRMVAPERDVPGKTAATSWANPTAKAINAGYYIARGVGIVGDATTVINVGGNYSNNVASTTTGNLASSTLNFIGGSGGYKTFEVGDAASRERHGLCRTLVANMVEGVSKAVPSTCASSRRSRN